MTFVACSPKHKSCSAAHSALVQGYRDERHRQEVQLEGWTGGYVGDVIQWMAKGGKLIDFRDWLKAHRRDHDNEHP